jgi:hypothetical protein
VFHILFHQLRHVPWSPDPWPWLCTSPGGSTCGLGFPLRVATWRCIPCSDAYKDEAWNYSKHIRFWIILTHFDRLCSNAVSGYWTWNRSSKVGAIQSCWDCRCVPSNWQHQVFSGPERHVLCRWKNLPRYSRLCCPQWRAAQADIDRTWSARGPITVITSRCCHPKKRGSSILSHTHVHLWVLHQSIRRLCYLLSHKKKTLLGDFPHRPLKSTSKKKDNDIMILI